jgi:Pyruvate/2-oxoacid:ferredoxin oxidoreductase delta subunit/DNA-binding transcriptional ArsR family regulator
MAEATLYQQLAGALGAGDSTLIPKIFETLVNEDQAKVVLAAAPPATAEELAEKTGISQERVEGMMRVLFEKGLIFKSLKDGVTRYYRVRHVPQLHDATVAALDASKELLALWKQYMDKEWLGYSRRIEAFLPRPAVRVLPVEVTLEPGARIMAFDDVKSIVANAKNLAVTRCTCRVIDGSCGKPVEVCIQVNRAADYAIERGTGRKLGKEEAILMLKKCEEEGLVHVSDNRQEVDHVICNCCQDCCMNWPSLRAGSRKFVVPSRFQAVVDPELCTACETCLDRCYFEAIAMTGEADTALVGADKCMGCGLCAVTCPTDAIRLKEVRPADSIPQH